MIDELIICLPTELRLKIFFNVLDEFTTKRHQHKNFIKLKKLLFQSATAITVYTQLNETETLNVSKCVDFANKWGPLIFSRAKRACNE